jgi:hypothetical protein
MVYTMDAYELVDVLDRRRRIAIGEHVRSPERPPAMPAPSPAIDGSSPPGPTEGSLSLCFEGSAKSGRPAAAGSFVRIGRTLASARRIARRAGEHLVDGVIDGEAATACIVLVADVGPIVFAKSRIGTRVLAPATADRDTVVRFSRLLVPGPVWRDIALPWTPPPTPRRDPRGSGGLALVAPSRFELPLPP